MLKRGGAYVNVNTTNAWYGTQGDTAGWRGKDAKWRGVVKELSVVEVTRRGELQRAVRARALGQMAKAALENPVEVCVR